MRRTFDNIQIIDDLIIPHIHPRELVKESVFLVSFNTKESMIIPLGRKKCRTLIQMNQAHLNRTVEVIKDKKLGKERKYTKRRSEKPNRTKSHVPTKMYSDSCKIFHSIRLKRYFSFPLDIFWLCFLLCL